MKIEKSRRVVESRPVCLGLYNTFATVTTIYGNQALRRRIFKIVGRPQSRTQATHYSDFKFGLCIFQQSKWTRAIEIVRQLMHAFTQFPRQLLNSNMFELAEYSGICPQ